MSGLLVLCQTRPRLDRSVPVLGRRRPSLSGSRFAASRCGIKSKLILHRMDPAAAESWMKAPLFSTAPPTTRHWKGRSCTSGTATIILWPLPAALPTAGRQCCARDPFGAVRGPHCPASGRYQRQRAAPGRIQSWSQAKDGSSISRIETLTAGSSICSRCAGLTTGRSWGQR